MTVSVEDTGTLGRRLTITVPDGDIQTKVAEKFKMLAKEAHLKGFRPGKVPMRVLEQKFGPSVRNEVIQDAIKKSLTDAVESHELQVAGAPTIESIKDEAGKDLEFTAQIEIFPKIELKDLADIEIEKRVAEVTDQDVESMITKLCDELGDWHPVERAVQDKDKLTVDFARTVKDVSEAKQSQNQVQMIVGHEGVIPGLNEALIGKAIGDDFSLELTYPADWAESAVAGKPVTLSVKIHQIDEKHPLTEATLAEKLNVDKEDSQALRDKIRDKMVSELELALKDELKESVLEKFIEVNQIEIPTALIEQEKKTIQQEMSRKQSMPLSSEEITESAQRRVELGLLLNEVIKKHSLKADGEKVRLEIDKLASRFPDKEKMLELYYQNHELLNSVERLVLLEQAVEVLAGQAKLIEKKASFDDIMNEGRNIS